MGTRAAFWIGNPVNLDKREWLGCIAFDGHPENFEELIVGSESDFRDKVADIEREGNFAVPSGGWPFPWNDDIFLTDVTYAFFDGQTHVAIFHRAFWPLKRYLQSTDDYPDEDLPTHRNVPAGKNYDPSQPDSILIMKARRNA